MVDVIGTMKRKIKGIPGAIKRKAKKKYKTWKAERELYKDIYEKEYKKQRKKAIEEKARREAKGKAKIRAKKGFGGEVLELFQPVKKKKKKTGDFFELVGGTGGSPKGLDRDLFIIPKKRKKKKGLIF